MEKNKKQKNAKSKKNGCGKKSPSFFKGKEPCWEIRGCVGKPGGAPECPVYLDHHYPCWEWQNTICKGVSGKDVSVCKICEVYLRYGNGARIGTPQRKMIKK